MTQLQVLVAFSVVCAIFFSAQGVPYIFYQHEQCAVNKLNVSDLSGDWHLVYHKDKLPKKTVTKISHLGGRALQVAVQEDGNLVKTYNLTQHESLPGKLENLVNRGSWTAAIPTFVLSVEPDKYMTLYHANENNSDDYAIYSRTAVLSEDNYNKAIQGLVCLRLVDSSGKPLLHKL
ncbi:hypothetical protein TYRP_021634 [Tyrophagus putrescentiae]|nr:hypothetical protein TYRP_021634 [Tyrophagus putrescentiae]